MLGTYNRDAIARVRKDLDECERQLDEREARDKVAAIADPAEFVSAARALPREQFASMLFDPGTQLHRVIDALYDLDPELFAIAERSLGKARIDAMLQEVPSYVRVHVKSAPTEPAYEDVDEWVDGPAVVVVYDEIGQPVAKHPGPRIQRRVRRKKTTHQRASVESVEIAFPAASPPAAFVRLDELRNRGVITFSSYGKYDAQHTPLVTLNTPALVDGQELLEQVVDAWLELAPELRAKISTERLSDEDATRADGNARATIMRFGGGYPPWPRRARRGTP